MQLLGDKLLGLANFFLGIGVPGDAKDFFNQIDSLACLEDNRYLLIWFLSFQLKFYTDIIAVLKPCNIAIKKKYETLQYLLLVLYAWVILSQGFMLWSSVSLATFLLWISYCL